jgi:hypothetical protein
MTTHPVTTPSDAGAPTERLPRVRTESPAAVARRRIATDPTLAGLPADAHVHSEHGTGVVFVHGRRFTLVEVLQDVGAEAMEALIARRDELAKRAAAVVVAGRMTVGAARRAQHAAVRFVALGDLTG